MTIKKQEKKTKSEPPKRPIILINHLNFLRGTSVDYKAEIKAADLQELKALIPFADGKCPFCDRDIED